MNRSEGRPGRSEGRKRRVVVFGTYDLDAHPRARVLIEGMRAHGVVVVECNAALGLDTAGRVGVLTRPALLPLVAGRVLWRWTELLWRSLGVGRPEAVLVPYLGHFDVHLARLRFPSTPRILDHLVSGLDTARDRRLGGGWRDRALGLVDRAALRAATVVVVDTDEHLEQLHPAARRRALVVPVGAPDSWAVAPGPLYAGDRPLRVVFFGRYTPLQGAVTIGRALSLLAANPSVQVTMIGDGQDRAEARRVAGANPNVTWHGPVPPTQLPAVVAAHDVCLGVFGTGPKALRVVPNKVFQGVRAGCAIVTSDTAPQRRVLGDVPVYVPPGDATELAAQLSSLAGQPERVRAAQERSRRSGPQLTPSVVTAPLMQTMGWSADR